MSSPISWFARSCFAIAGGLLTKLTLAGTIGAIGAASVAAVNPPESVLFKRLQLSETLYDSSRRRKIALQMYFPADSGTCGRQRICRTAIIASGYGVRHTEYSFLAQALSQRGYLVLAPQLQLPSDPVLARSGDLYAQRLPVWQSGVLSLQFIREQMAARFPEYDWQQLLLLGHSNGGDIVSLYAQDASRPLTGLITLDHRRVALPRRADLPILSLRATDFSADPGVLPSTEELLRLPRTRIFQLETARHNDLSDSASPALKRILIQQVQGFLQQGD